MSRFCSVMALLLISFVQMARADSPALDVSFNADVFKVGFSFPAFTRAAVDTSWLHSEDDGDVLGGGGGVGHDLEVVEGVEGGVVLGVRLRRPRPVADRHRHRRQLHQALHLP